MQILIVDDDMATVDVIQYTVEWERLGIKQIYKAYNIENAKNILKEKRIDIIISDIEMPQGSGIDLLTWFRDESMEGEFLLLTCHESFDYANNAVKLHAAEYLLKPFDVTVMESALKKIILKIKEEKLLKENSEYGKWVKKNQRQLKIAFWNMVLTGHILKSGEKLKKEIQNRNLDIDAEQDYRIVVSKITNLEKDKEKINTDLILFIMENIHSEFLCGNPENDSVICFDYRNHYVIVSICKNEDELKLESKCEALIEGAKNIFTANITCCISNPCKIWEFYQTLHKNLDLIETNIVYYGGYFNEEQAITDHSPQIVMLELDCMEEFIKERKKMEFLSYLKERINDKVNKKILNEQALWNIKQEVLQVIYTYLGKKEIMASGLFVDDGLDELSKKASQSVTDLIRWVNFLLERTFYYEDEIKKKYTVVDKINQYIREHYKENIGRNEIGIEFFLAPEYLSKMYKKETGNSLNDYISEYRIEKAKTLLERGDRVSDVAEEVGFENFTYFSTIFKKYTGISPSQYRRKKLGE